MVIYEIVKIGEEKNANSSEHEFIYRLNNLPTVNDSVLRNFISLFFIHKTYLH